MAVRRRRDKAVVLLRSDARQRLEPVRKVRRSVLHCPLAHRICDGVCEREIKLLALVHGIAQAAVDTRREPRTHDLVVKHHASKQFRYRAHDHSSKLVLLIGRHRPAEASATYLCLPICAYLTLHRSLCQDKTAGFFACTARIIWIEYHQNTVSVSPALSDQNIGLSPVKTASSLHGECIPHGSRLRDAHACDTLFDENQLHHQSGRSLNESFSLL